MIPIASVRQGMLRVHGPAGVEAATPHRGVRAGPETCQLVLLAARPFLWQPLSSFSFWLNDLYFTVALLSKMKYVCLFIFMRVRQFSS